MVDFRAKLAEKRAKDKLAEQLAKVKKGSAPNLDPWAGRKAKYEKVEVEKPPDISELGVPLKKRVLLSELMDRHREISILMADLKKEKDSIVERIKPVCAEYNLERFTVGDKQGSYYAISRSKISKELLLASGVSPATVVKCTETKEAWAFRCSDAAPETEENETSW